MGLDLNSSQGFQSLTSGLGGISNLLTSLTGAIQDKWDIDESSYGHDGKQVLFHVFKSAADFNAAVGHVQDSSGHRKVPIVFPYKDGQSSDDLGRKGESFDFDVVIHGPNYKAQYKKLLKELNDPRPGTLVHPVRGQITVAAEDWPVTHSSDKIQAVALRIRFIEHSFSVDYSSIPVVQNVPSALTKAIAFIATIAGAITKAESVLFVLANTRSLVSNLFSSYQDDYTATLVKLNNTFNSSGSSLIPGLAPTVPGLDPTVFTVAGSPDNAFAGTAALQSGQSSQELSSALASQQAVDQVAALRTSLEDKILTIQALEDGQGALIFYDDLLSLKESAVALQDVLELGLQSSKNKIISYQTPRIMSVREVCFANGLSPDSSYDLEVLNPDLLSLNKIPAGTMVQVPT